MTIKTLLGAAAFTVLVALPAAAATLSWNLEASYSDGVTASGSYDFDADTTVFSNINILTSIGETLSFVSPVSKGNDSFLSFVSNALGTNGSSFYVSQLSLAMTNAGGTIDMLPSISTAGIGFSFGGQCGGTPDCSGIFPVRDLTSGSVSTISAVPLPAGAILLLSALAGVAGLKRRKKKHTA